jgi:hypothetical protein
MAVSRDNKGGKAVMALSVDSAPPADLVPQLHEGGFDEVYVVDVG